LLFLYEKQVESRRETSRSSTTNEMKIYNTLRGTWLFRKTIYVSLFVILTV